MRYYIQDDGDKLRIPIIIRNGGFQDTNVTATFTIPTGLTVYTDPVIEQGTWADPVWTIGTMPGNPNEGSILLGWLPLEVDDITEQPFTISYTVAGDNTDPNLPNNTTTYELTSFPKLHGLELDAAIGETAGVGQMVWNADEETIDVGISANVTGQMFQEQFYFARNESGGDIPDGTVVRFVGTHGASGKLLIDLMLADGSVPTEHIMGVTTELIPDNGTGRVTSFGKVRGIDTSGGVEAWIDGELLYADPATPGGLTKVKPNSHNKSVLVATAIYANASNGILQVRPTIVPSIQDLYHNHTRTEVANYDIDHEVDFHGTVLADVGCDVITLPDIAVVREGDWFKIKQIDITAQLRVDPTFGDGSLIEGLADYQFSTLYEKITVQSDGTNWWLV